MALCTGHFRGGDLGNFKVIHVKNSDNSILETITWITPFIDIKTMNIHHGDKKVIKMVIKIEKTMKPYSKATILSLKNYKNIKFNFLIPPLDLLTV